MRPIGAARRRPRPSRGGRHRRAQQRAVALDAQRAADVRATPRSAVCSESTSATALPSTRRCGRPRFSPAVAAGPAGSAMSRIGRPRPQRREADLRHEVAFEVLRLEATTGRCVTLRASSAAARSSARRTRAARARRCRGRRRPSAAASAGRPASAAGRRRSRRPRTAPRCRSRRRWLPAAGAANSARGSSTPTMFTPAYSSDREQEVGERAGRDDRDALDDVLPVERTRQFRFGQRHAVRLRARRASRRSRRAESATAPIRSGRGRAPTSRAAGRSRPRSAAP